MNLNIVKLQNVPIFEQLKLEEALLRADDGNWCLLNEGSSPAVVMGISGKPEQLIDHEEWEKRSLPLIRRFSGGGTVVVDQNTLFVTMICNEGAVNIPSFPNQILCWNGSLYKTLLQHVNFQIKENDYAIGTKKFGGNAQYICKKRWLHHTSILWNYNQEMMKVLKIPPKMPKYRDGRVHDDFLCSLENYVESKDLFYQELIAALSERFKIEERIYTETVQFLNLPHRKATHTLHLEHC